MIRYDLDVFAELSMLVVICICPASAKRRLQLDLAPPHTFLKHTSSNFYILKSIY